MGDFFGHAYCGGARPWITHLTTQLLFSSLLSLSLSSGLSPFSHPSSSLCLALPSFLFCLSFYYLSKFSSSLLSRIYLFPPSPHPSHWNPKTNTPIQAPSSFHGLFHCQHSSENPYTPSVHVRVASESLREKQCSLSSLQLFLSLLDGSWAN